MRIGVLRRSQDSADVDAALEALLAQGEALEFFEAVAVGGAVDDRVAEDIGVYAREVDRRVGCGARIGIGRGVRAAGVLRVGVLELPGVARSVMNQPRVVVPLVEVLENGGENLRFLIGEVNPPALRIKELLAAGPIEEGRLAEDIFVRSKEPALAADGQGDDGGGRGGLRRRVLLVVERSLQFRQLLVSGDTLLLLLESGGLVDAVLGLLRAERALEHGGDFSSGSTKERLGVDRGGLVQRATK